VIWCDCCCLVSFWNQSKIRSNLWNVGFFLLVLDVVIVAYLEVMY
jgi:hypothetical protein